MEKKEYSKVQKYLLKQITLLVPSGIAVKFAHKKFDIPKDVLREHVKELAPKIRRRAFSSFLLFSTLGGAWFLAGYFGVMNESKDNRSYGLLWIGLGALFVATYYLCLLIMTLFRSK